MNKCQPNLSNEEYQAHPAISASGLLAFKECPRLYYERYVARNPLAQISSEAIERGSLAHLAVLEPEEFDKKYTIAPPQFKDRRLKDFKDYAKSIEGEGKEILLKEKGQEIFGMREEIKRHSLASKIIEAGKKEVSFFATDEETGLEMRARPDILYDLPGFGLMMVDYKTTTLPLDKKKQASHAFGLGRHIQAAHHKAVVERALNQKITHVLYIVQSQNFPYLVRILRMPDHILQFANDERFQLLAKLKTAYQESKWGGYPEEIEDYEEPGWLKFEGM